MELLESCEIISLQNSRFLSFPAAWDVSPGETPQAARNEAMWNGAKPRPQGVSLGNKDR